MIASVAQMSTICQKCGSAIGTSLWFDNEDDAGRHRESELHMVVRSQTDPRLLNQFKQHLNKHKPKNMTGTEFSSAVQREFILFRNAGLLQQSAGNWADGRIGNLLLSGLGSEEYWRAGT